MKKEPVPTHRLFVFVSIGIVAASSSAIFIRFCQSSGLTVAFWRVSFALLLLSPVWLSKKRRLQLLHLSFKDRMTLAASGLFLGLHFWAWVSSLTYTSVGASVLLVTTNPIWVGLFSPFFLGVRLSKRAWWGIAVSLLGGMWIAFDASGNAPIPRPLLGNALALLGSIAASGYILMGKRVRPRLDLGSYAFMTLLGAWLTLVVALFATREPIMSNFGAEWPLFLAMAAFPQLVGHNSINWSLRYISADRVAVILLCEPIGSALLAWPLLGEAPSSRLLIGAIFLLCGVAIVILSPKQRTSF